jgi:hypothetical protein
MSRYGVLNRKTGVLIESNDSETAKEMIRNLNRESQEYNDFFRLCDSLIAGGFNDEDTEPFFERFCFSDDEFYAQNRVYSYIVSQ